MSRSLRLGQAWTAWTCRALQCQEYRQSPEFIARRTLLDQMVDPEAYRDVFDARTLLVRARGERGPPGTATPPDRITNAMGGQARLGSKGRGAA